MMRHGSMPLRWGIPKWGLEALCDRLSLGVTVGIQTVPIEFVQIPYIPNPLNVNPWIL